MTFPLPVNENARVAELHGLNILDTPVEPEYLGLAKLAAQVAGTPIAVVSLVDAERQWAKAAVGIDDWTAPRSASVCAHAITSPDGVLVVPDLRMDARFADSPLVVDGPKLRFYAGATIRSEAGHAVATLCVADTVPRELDAAQLDSLKSLAGQASALLALRRRTVLLEQLTGRLESLALRDELTDLPNRTLLLDRLHHALATHERKHRGLTVMFVDVDDFKSYNDAFGHEIGDEVLHAVASRLKTAAREMDTVGRLAGDEFLVMCPELTDPSDIVRVRYRLEQAVERPVECAGGRIVPSVTIGTTIVRDGDTPIDVLRRADLAVHAAKRTRRSDAA